MLEDLKMHYSNKYDNSCIEARHGDPLTDSTVDTEARTLKFTPRLEV